MEVSFFVFFFGFLNSVLMLYALLLLFSPFLLEFVKVVPREDLSH